MTTNSAFVSERTNAPPSSRLAYMDNLRILLTVLVVLHHAAVTYGNIPVGYYLEPAGDPTGSALDLFLALNQTFFMGFFFMISGFFVPGSFDRKQSKAFWRSRLKRLGIPLLLFILVARPILTSWLYVTEYKDAVPYWLFYIFSWDPGPMWFVEVLLVFCLGYLLIRRWSSKPPPAPDHTTQPPATGRLPGVPAIIGFTLVLSLATVAWRLLVPIDSFWPILGLPTPSYLPQYLGLFIVGAYAFSKGWFVAIPRAAMWWSGALTLLLVPARLVAVAMLEDRGETLWQQLLHDVIECGLAVNLILLLLSVFQRFANKQNATTRFLSDNAFAVYFLHMMVLLGVGLALRGWDGAAIAKFAVLAAIALPLSWGAAALLRTIPAARRIF